jgi:diphthine-ammonia ligase
MVLESGIVKNGELVSFEEWSEYIDSLRKKEAINDEKKAVSLLKDIFVEAVKKRIPKKKFGIFFSGGVDSTLIAFICKKVSDDFIAYTVGIEGSKDIEASSEVAKQLGIKHVKKILSIKEAEQAFEKTAQILGKEQINIVNLGVGAVVVAAIELAEKDNIHDFFSGLGSEELYAGYQRHEKSSDINEECWAGLKTTWGRDFQRDFLISKNKNATFLTPFLDKQLIIESMKIDSRLKINDGCKKYIIRQVAVSLGLKKEMAFRPKIAAQYGSNFDKAIQRVSKQKGFKFKKEYLQYLIDKQ